MATAKSKGKGEIDETKHSGWKHDSAWLTTDPERYQESAVGHNTQRDKASQIPSRHKDFNMKTAHDCFGSPTLTISRDFKASHSSAHSH
jgi:hypothetical protein